MNFNLKDEKRLTRKGKALHMKGKPYAKVCSKRTFGKKITPPVKRTPVFGKALPLPHPSHREAASQPRGPARCGGPGSGPKAVQRQDDLRPE